MIGDPIVEEIHKTRERLLEEFGGMEGLLQHLREIESEMKDQVVRLEPRPPIEHRRKTS